MEERQANGDGGFCRLGCHEIEDEYHVFTRCPAFEEWRKQAGLQLRKALEERLKSTDAAIANAHKNKLLTKAEYFYSDDSELWPLKESQFYLGHVPKLVEWLSKNCTGASSLMRERLTHGIYCEWHNASVRLASRIFGELQRRATRSWDQKRRGISLSY